MLFFDSFFIIFFFGFFIYELFRALYAHILECFQFFCLVSCSYYGIDSFFGKSWLNLCSSRSLSLETSFMWASFRCICKNSLFLEAFLCISSS
ncbi:unnamed protein product [Moneuplotes crassus]|uniref:Uncharacterized protein n=1 Tax=Euplotes crassus TaxID=5936 RepID=A0AAD2D2Y6_EUPCR|nr:unnamed protein product [Moneuplotes crassus]